jgi:hypothetical protein
LRYLGAGEKVMKPADKAYAERGREHDPDPAEEVFGEVKALVAVIAVTATVTLLSFLIWGKF